MSYQGFVLATILILAWIGLNRVITASVDSLFLWQRRRRWKDYAQKQCDEYNRTRLPGMPEMKFDRKTGLVSYRTLYSDVHGKEKLKLAWSSPGANLGRQLGFDVRPRDGGPDGAA